MVEKKDGVVCIPAHLRIDSKVLSGFIRIQREKLEFKPTSEKRLKDLKNKDLKRALTAKWEK